jgi:peptidoglycan/LPS O-acetylase OafA/YrhL
MHFKRIDQFRGFAALAVVLCHAAVSAESVVVDPAQQVGYALSRFLGFGYLGVPLFFVISGLCIHLPAARALAARGVIVPDWGRFFRRRFWRLYPSYLAALVVAVLLMLLVRGALPVDGRGLLAQMLLVHTFDPATFDGVNPPAWTLAVEAQLYLAYPIVLALWVRRGPWRALGLVLAITMLYRWSLNFGVVPDYYGGVAWEFFLARWWEWTLGALLAGWAVGTVRLPRVVRSPWLAAVVLALAVRFEWEMWRSWLYTFKEPMYGLAFALVVLAGLDREQRGGGVGTTRFGRYCAEVGVFSYSLYLLHRPLQLAVEPLVAMLARVPLAHVSPLAVSLVLMGATTPVVVAAARVFHRFCEAPSVAIANRVGRSASARPYEGAPLAREKEQELRS